MEFQKFIVTVQLPVVLFLIGASVQSARAFRKMRFLIIACGWSANLLYLGAHALSLRNAEPLFTFLASLFVLLSSLCFLAAARLVFRLEKDDTHVRVSVPLPLKAGIALFFVAVIMAFVETWLIPPGGAAPPTKGWPRAIIDVVFHFYAISNLAHYLKGEHQRVAVGGRLFSGSGILPLGTYGYAAIQPIYLIALTAGPPLQARIMETGFFLGLIAKAAISVGYFHLFVNVTQHAVRERARFDEAKAVVGRINHEAMTPLLEIGLSVEELQREVPNRGRARASIADLDSALERVRAILEAARNISMLDGSSFAGDQNKLLSRSRELAVVNVNSLVQTAVMAVKSTRPEVSVTWTLQYSKGACILCVPSEVVQVMVNLLRNAYDALPAQRGEICIVTSRVREPALVAAKVTTPLAQPPEQDPGLRELVRVEVRDNGEGVVPEIRSKIFTEGFSTRSGEGRGYGLYMVQRLVSENGGTLELRSPLFPERPHSPGTGVVVEFPRVACKRS